MSRLRIRLAQDKALRDAALNLFTNDLRVIRNELNARTVGARLVDRLGDGATEILDDAIDYAEDNRGKVGAIVAAALLWFGRRPILRAAGLADEYEDDDPEAEPDYGPDGSETQ